METGVTLFPEYNFRRGLTRGKYQRVPQNLDNLKNSRLWNWVEHWVTYPNATPIGDENYPMLNSIQNGVWSNSVPGRQFPLKGTHLQKLSSRKLGTELLQSPFRTEFSMGSLSRRYRQSLRCYRRFLQNYRRSLRRQACRDP